MGFYFSKKQQRNCRTTDIWTTATVYYRYSELIVVIGEFETFVMQLLSQLTLLFLFFLQMVSTGVGLMKLPPDWMRCLSALYGWQMSNEILI
jgi:hypothetical protein